MRRPPSPTAFTLIETMLVVLLVGLLSAGVAVSLSRPLQAGRARDAVRLVTAFDATGRQLAVASGQGVRLRFDLSDDSLSQFDGNDLGNRRTRVPLPRGTRVDRVRIGGRVVAVGVFDLDVTARGWARPYAAHLSGPGLDRWLCFGLAGDTMEVADESQLPAAPLTPGYDTD